MCLSRSLRNNRLLRTHEYESIFSLFPTRPLNWLPEQRERSNGSNTMRADTENYHHKKINNTLIIVGRSYDTDECRSASVCVNDLSMGTLHSCVRAPNYTISTGWLAMRLKEHMQNERSTGDRQDISHCIRHTAHEISSYFTTVIRQLVLQSSYDLASVRLSVRNFHDLKTHSIWYFHLVFDFNQLVPFFCRLCYRFSFTKMSQ